MAGVPKFIETGGNALVNYSQIDIATGRSMTNLYAGVLSGATLKGVISNVPFYSDMIFITQPLVGQNLPFNFEMNFDLPMTIEGDAIIQTAFGSTKAGAGTESILLSISMAKISTDGTSTDIIAGDTKTLYNIGGAGNTMVSRASIYLTFPRTNFRRNEKLRMQVKETGTDSGFILACDPEGRQEGIFDTLGLSPILILQIPFRVYT